MNRKSTFALLAAALTLAAAAPAAAPPNAAAVHIQNFRFGPQTLTVPAGTTVTFVNDDEEPHNVTAADHSYRSALTGDEQLAAPRTVRLAVDIIEAEAHLPLTVSSIAARCHASVRSLQHGFRRYIGVSPMEYLREVRLRRAHQSLLASDQSATSVASVAYQWGFKNLGRFAAAHTARYDEPPAATLRRTARQGQIEPELS